MDTCRCQHRSCLGKVSLVYAVFGVIAALTLGLVGAWNGGHITLTALEVGEVTSLVMHIHDLLVTLGIEGTHALSSRSVESFLKIRAQTAPSSGSFLRNLVLLIDGLSPFSGMVLGVEVGECLLEATANSVLLVDLKSSLNGLVADGVAVSEVFGDDTSARLVFLADLSTLLVMTGSLTASNLIEGCRRGDLNLRWAELGVVQQQSSLCCGLFFKCNSCRFGRGVGRINGK